MVGLEQEQGRARGVNGTDTLEANPDSCFDI
jgi:hypothetical protein